MINLNKFSTENIRKTQKFLEIVLNHIELFGGYNRLAGNKIPLEKFKNENIDYYEVLAIISGLGDKIAEQLNEYYKKELSCFAKSNLLASYCSNVAYMGFKEKEDYLRFFNITEEELKNYIILVIKDLNKLKEIKKKIDRKLKEKAKTYSKEVRRQFEELDEKQKEKEELKKEIIEELKEKGGRKTIATPRTFELQVKDREIWINNYLLSKPFAVGSNFEFFEYIRSKPPNTLITRDKMPNVGDGIGYGYTKEAIKNKGFIKILNELGFKGEILKAFFPKRGKNTVVYRGDKITKKDLEKAGAKMSLFLKELELAHLKNSPE